MRPGFEWCMGTEMRLNQLFAVTLVAFVPLTFACGDDHADDDHHAGGNTECLALGEYCHEAGEIDAAAAKSKPAAPARS